MRVRVSGLTVTFGMAKSGCIHSFIACSCAFAYTCERVGLEVTFRRMRRMIFPDRVFGSPVSAQWNWSGAAKAPT